jgi:1-acyl-sn-glycerol-3-phosphate acyltransferase
VSRVSILGEKGFWYSLFQPLVRLGIGVVVRSEFEGLDKLPRSGGFLLVPNHQSVLDPLLLQGKFPRAVSSMTKSTQFSRGFFRWVLPRVHAFPVRRYRVDPQSVRIVLRRLEEGRVVCVYPEGERSWDGTMQAFRRGTIRMILRAGVPVVPVAIDGTYRAWPRWSSRPWTPLRRFTVKVRFGDPLHFGEIRNRAAREAALPEAERCLREAIDDLLREGEHDGSDVADASAGAPTVEGSSADHR